MPANKKHLLQSNWAKASKIIASILGAFIASASLHLALALWLNKEMVSAISIVTIYLLWALFIILIYWLKKQWMVWGILMGITLVSITAIYISK